MSPIDREYLERRRQESLARAEAAADPAITGVHRQFASHYARQLETAPVIPVNVIQ